jgi:hypothetical protein
MPPQIRTSGRSNRPAILKADPILLKCYTLRTARLVDGVAFFSGPIVLDDALAVRGGSAYM